MKKMTKKKVNDREKAVEDAKDLIRQIRERRGEIPESEVFVLSFLDELEKGMRTLIDQSPRADPVSEVKLPFE